MDNDKVFQIDFGKIYGLLLNKAVKKGRTKREDDQVISWMTGYSEAEIEECRAASVCNGGPFPQGPSAESCQTADHRHDLWCAGRGN